MILRCYIRQMTKRVLLVHPEFPVTYWGFQDSVSVVNKKAALPPLGLVTLAACLPESWTLHLVDLNIEPLTDADLEWAEAVNWMVCVRLDSSIAHHRDRMLGNLRAEGIDTRPFFVPAAELPPYKNAPRVGVDESDVPVSRKVGYSGFNLPTSPALSISALVFVDTSEKYVGEPMMTPSASIVFAMYSFILSSS